ncbi:specifically androgen-regulated gene protein [Spea bombifrons]|uniref:specifically androgen-regulated gene protein n=1 Tax=Spea bombifrons TaxID=233779 RepID=UPI00234BEEA2|nr:specifically androgen-regulated gene protein [Spea bombifrons]
MPEKVLWARNVGMETLGSTGSCDSMESISSNHSAFSGDYDHLSKEERECLMFLEETIDSLDNEVDSGLSNDESETAENIPSQPSSEPARIPPSSGDDKAPIKSTVIHTTEERRENHEEVNKMPPKQGYHSFPRIIQGSKDEIPKPLSESKLLDSMDKAKLVHGKPKSLTAINQEGVEQTSTTDLILLPPPEPFRDPQFVDKRRSVNDPTDVRETRLEKLLPKLSTNALYKEASPAVGHYPDKVPPVVKFPRPLSPNPVAMRSQEVVITLADKHGEFKQGPPTAPKPPKLPPHIRIKPSTGGGVISNLDPQQRPRAYSAHERNTDKSSGSSNTKLPHSKEQESAHQEALQKLGLLQEKGNKEEHNSNKPSVTPKTEQISVSHEAMEHGQKDAYRKSVNITQQDRPNVLGTSPVQPSVLALRKGVESVVIINEGFSRKRLSMKSNSLERSDELGGVLAQDEGSPRSVKANAVGRGTLCVASRPQEKENEMAFPTPKEAEPQTNKSPKLNPKSTALKNQVNMKSSHQEKPDEPIDRPVLAHKDAQSETDTTVKYSKVSLGGNSTALKTNSLEKGIMSQEGHPISETASNLPNADKPLENRTKIGSSDNINMISTSPGKTFSFPRPKDVSIPSTSPEVALRGRKSQAANDKSKRHSSHMESSGEQYLRLPQSSVAGLRQINIKSNTLERSGVGLSSSMSSSEDQNRKGSGSFFKKSIFSGNFLRNSRPRPASLGTGKDFAGMEPSTSEAEVKESRESIIFRKSHPVAPVTSVKITPKGSTDEHRREALKKLGILKE